MAEYCDGWFPIHQDPRRAAASGCGGLRLRGWQPSAEAWAEAGRGGEPDFSIFGVGPDGERVRELIEMGFNRIIFALPPADPDTVLPMLDNYAAIAYELQNAG